MRFDPSQGCVAEWFHPAVEPRDFHAEPTRGIGPEETAACTTDSVPLSQTEENLFTTPKRCVARVLRAQPHPTGCERCARTGLQPGGVRCGAKVARARSKGASCPAARTVCGLDLQGARRRQRRLFSITSRYRDATESIPGSERTP